MTAHYLTHSTYPIQRGDEVLIHAGAGGTGLLFIQMAKALGARVFTTVSTEEKAALARAAGADEIIFYTRKTSPRRSSNSPQAAAFPSSTTPSAKPPSSNPSSASAPAASWSSSAEPAEPSHPSTSSASPPWARSTSPAPP